VLPANQVEELITVVSMLDKPALVRQFQQYPATFPVDFTAEFLDTQPVDRLRHLFVALCVQSQRFPEIPAGEA
jgi:hypothetical protein